MCGGDDQLVWKHPVSLEASRGLRTIGWYDRFCQGSFSPLILSYRATSTLQVSLDPIKISFLHMGASVDFQSCLVTIGFSYPLHGLLLVCSEIGTYLSFNWATFLLSDQCVSTSFEFSSCHLSFRTFVPYRSVIRFSLDSTSYIRVGNRLIRVSKQLGMDLQHDTVDQLTVTMTLFKRHQQV